MGSNVHKASENKEQQRLGHTHLRCGEVGVKVPQQLLHLGFRLGRRRDLAPGIAQLSQHCQRYLLRYASEISGLLSVSIQKCTVNPGQFEVFQRYDRVRMSQS